MLVKLDAERMRALPLAPVDGFVLSRIDGSLTVDDLAQIMGLPIAQVLTSLQKLQQMNLVALPQPSGPQRMLSGAMRIAPPAAGRATPVPPRDSRPPRGAHNPAPQSSGTERAAARTPSPISERPHARTPAAQPSPPPQKPVPRAEPAPEPKASTTIATEGVIPEEGVEIEEEHQRLIQDLFERLADLNHYDILGVARTSDKKTIKRAYFELASKFHPDKFFRKNLGSFRLKMEAIFRNVTEAHDVLTSKAQRTEYDAYIASLEKTRGMEAMLEDAMAEIKRAEEAARMSVPAPSPPLASPSPPSPSQARKGASAPPQSTATPNRKTPSSKPPTLTSATPAPASSRARPPPLPGVPPAPSSSPARPQAPSMPSSSPPLTSPNLGAFIADALGGTTPKPASEPQSRASGTARISVHPPSDASAAADVQARRDMLARRLTGALGPRVPSAPKVPAIQFATPADAVDALKRRYEEKVGAARASQAKKYADIGAAARAKNDHVAAANAYRVAVSFATDDEELKRAAEETQRASDEILSDAYFKQAQYEERSEHWGEAAKSWGRVTRARPTDAKAHEHAAQCIVKANGNLHEAAAFAQKAVTLAPQHVPARITLANVYLAAGLALNAKRELDAAAQLAPEDATVQALLKRVAKGGA